MVKKAEDGTILFETFIRDRIGGATGSGGFGDVDGDVEVIGDFGEPGADVALRAEPELVAVGESGGEGLADEKAAGAVAAADGGSLIEQRSGVEDLQDLGWGRRMACWSPSASSAESWPGPGWWTRCRSR